MKKIILLPKTDTVILCLPEKWVGIPVICKLEPMDTHFMDHDEMEIEIERMVVFRNKIKRKKKK